MGEVVGVAVSNVFIGTCSDATLGVDRRTLDPQMSCFGLDFETKVPIICVAT